jgi:hypothetical protein|tara:strand:- start:19 stop:384 length:366 start_codon:yes stop_codon:yes gene_type:complete
MGCMATNIKYSYPQIYFLEKEACKHFGIKLRTYKNWIDSGLTIPGRYKVKGSNYYIIKPEEFHLWLIETRLEVATPQNKFHNRKVSSPSRSTVKKPTVLADFNRVSFSPGLSSANTERTSK